MTQHCVEFKLNRLNSSVDDDDEPEQWLKRGFRDIFDHLVASLNSEDKVGITFTADDFETDFHVPFKPVTRLKFENVWSFLLNLYQSKKEAIEGDTFKIIATSFTPFKGAGSGSRVKNYITFDEECAKRRGIVTIKNKDNLCLARALVVAMAYCLNTPYIRQVRCNISKRQDEEVQKLIEESCIEIPKEGAGVPELQKFQQHLKDFKITVYNYASKGRDVLFEGPDAKYKLNLIHHKKHFNVIVSLTGAFACSYFCDRCHVPYDQKDKHRCIGQCLGCQKTPPCDKVENEILCRDCNRKFRGQTCFDNHKASSAGRQSMCERVKRCSDCLKTIKSNRQHICGEIFCHVCKRHQSAGHRCFMQIDTSKPNLKETLFVFYDLETRQDEKNLKGENVHVPVLCVFQQRCRECFDLGNSLIECQKCGIRRQVLKTSIIQSFVQYLFSVSKNFKSVVVVAFNGQAYDHQFILNFTMEETDLKPDVIMRGSKILMMTLSKIKFIDAINYFPMKLAALPEAFGLEELKKGFFPHLFNTLQNKNYVGPIPDVKFFSPDTMKASDRTAFLKWYGENKNNLFDMEREMLEYCISDVDILTQACIKFHKMVMEHGNISPFTEAITIPGACNKLFRRNFLKPNTIGIIPKNGYRNTDIQSKIAIQWLLYEEEKRTINIQHAAKQREAVIDGVKVDGYCKETRQIFEFHGCYFHGCIQCFNSIEREAPLHEDHTDSLNARYERTVAKTQRLRNKGYEVIEMWEHEFRDILEKDRNLKGKLNEHTLLTYLPLNPRDAFYGGRTGCAKCYYHIKPSEKIKYVDVCSLYPWVCKYGKFPIGHPTVHTDCSELDLNKTEGLIKCAILPPQNLYHPVLPLKMNDKLMFVLCRKCGKELNQGECDHNDEERALIGTWTMDEVRKAMEKEYKIIEVYEVWQYDVTQYDKASNTGGLFAEMMNKFIKIKQEASDWPKGCVTKEERNAYIESFLNSEGIQLEFGKIVKNPGLRSLAKLILNSFWGKFGQRENQSKCSIIRQPSELYQLDTDPSKTINHVTIINEEVLLVSWTYKDEAVDTLSTVNVAVAAYVTAQARLKLYSYLELLGDRVLYYDTDSVIYVSRPGEWDVPTGSSLGEMTDELEEYGAGSYIVEFISAGPKNYSFKVHSPTTGYHQVCKIKGFNLNYQLSQQITPELMKQMVQTPNSEALTIEQSQIRRTQTHQLVTRIETKTYEPCLQKRKFDKDYESTPHGYKRTKKNENLSACSENNSKTGAQYRTEKTE